LKREFGAEISFAIKEAVGRVITNSSDGRILG
jgi:hypothetical protein